MELSGTTSLNTQRTPTNADIFRMAWPMALRAVMMFSLVIIDLYLVSSLGENAVAAIGIATIFTGLLLGTTFAFANAMQIKVAQAYGRDNPVDLKSAFYCGLLINVVIAGFGIVLIVLFSQVAIDKLAHSQSIAEGAVNYLYVFLLVIVAETFSSALTSHFNGCGKTRLAFYSFLISAPVNIITSIALIFGLYGMPELGLVGAAWGSFIGAFMRMVYLAYRFYRAHHDLHTAGGWTNDSLVATVHRQYSFSWPIAATFISMTFANQVCIAIYASMSVYHFAAMVLITPWVRVAGQLSYTWTQATGILLAQMIGKSLSALSLDEFLSRAWRAAFVAAALVAVVYALIIGSMNWVYSDLDEQTRLALLSFLPILLIIPFPRVSNAICGNVLRAAGDTKTSLNIHLMANWLVMVPLTALCVLVFNLHVGWVFALFLLEELFKFPLFHRRIWTKQWHTMQ